MTLQRILGLIHGDLFAWSERAFGMDHSTTVNKMHEYAAMCFSQALEL